MAAEYIEREAAIAETRKPRITDAELRRRLANIPAADVVPVRHGRWMTREYMYGNPDAGIDDEWVEKVAEYGDCAYCSECGKNAGLNGAEEYELSSYCPNCGARMDGDGDV